jgi:uncharacterized protein (DUF4415 family)
VQPGVPRARQIASADRSFPDDPGSHSMSNSSRSAASRRACESQAVIAPRTAIFLVMLSARAARSNSQSNSSSISTHTSMEGRRVADTRQVAQGRVRTAVLRYFRTDGHGWHLGSPAVHAYPFRSISFDTHDLRSPSCKRYPGQGAAVTTTTCRGTDRTVMADSRCGALIRNPNNRFNRSGLCAVHAAYAMSYVPQHLFGIHRCQQH